MQMEAQERACGSSFSRTAAAGMVFLTQAAFNSITEVYQAESYLPLPMRAVKHWLLNNSLFHYLTYFHVAFTFF